MLGCSGWLLGCCYVFITVFQVIFSILLYCCKGVLGGYQGVAVLSLRCSEQLLECCWVVTRVLLCRHLGVLNSC